MKPEHVKKDMANMINTLCIQRDPLGVVCVFSAWNYPVILLLQPLIGAIAAGTFLLSLYHILCNVYVYVRHSTLR